MGPVMGLMSIVVVRVVLGGEHYWYTCEFPSQLYSAQGHCITVRTTLGVRLGSRLIGLYHSISWGDTYIC